MPVIEIIIIGIGIVFLVLAILTGATIILGKLCQLGESLKSVKTEEKPPKKVKEKEVAIVSAAIASYLSKGPNQIIINSVNQINSKVSINNRFKSMNSLKEKKER